MFPQSIARGARLSRLPGLLTLRPARLLAPLRRIEPVSRPQRAFTSRLPADWSPALPLDMTTTWTGLLLAGLSPAGMAASLAAPDPDMRLSPHPARATQRRLAPSGEKAGFLRSPVDPTNTVSDPPPSLHGHYPASSLLWGGPSLTGPSVLSASRVRRLRLFPWHGQPGSQVPYESPDESHAS